MAKPTPLQIEAILEEMGEVGRHLHQMGACEGGAGNISAGVRDALEFRHLFPIEDQIQLPDPVPGLAGMTFICSGSGCRLRDIEKYPTANMGCLVVNEGGLTGQLFTGQDRQFTRLTSEFNTHLAVHNNEMSGGKLPYHAVLHAQPLYLTFLSHIERYQNEKFFNHNLLRWEPETIFQFPQGFGVCEYAPPGTAEMQAVTVEAMRSHTIAVWCKHGVMTRSNVSMMQAFDRIEYAETAARYEHFNLSMGEPSSGLSVDEILEFCKRHNVDQKVF
ncbi:MAG TPA: class II aldolase/adducin family protein [Anaerolineales bacterium]|nr:class II aldolase/adducin family protein [Anaerolineales bacterium]HNN12469.1 class II aldolase/adducin family protein [Anaerolineales bacterium]